MGEVLELGMAKQDGRKLDHQSLETLRLLAVRRVTEDGEKPREVMRSLGLCRTSIYPWLRTHKKKGQAALRMRKACGPQPKLTPQTMPASTPWDHRQGSPAVWFQFRIVDAADCGPAH